MTPADRGSLRTFLLVWLGQTVSVFGSQLAGFGLGLWLYQRTNSATLYGLAALANVLPLLLVAPLAGVAVDRCDRRLLLIAGEAGSGACSLILAVLFLMDALEPWAVLLCLALDSTFSALTSLALSTTTATLVPPQHLGRANGLEQLGSALVHIVAPAAGGLLLYHLGLAGILALDVLTFLFSIGVLLAVRIPRPAATAEGQASRGSAWQEALSGFRYLRERPGLFGLLVFYSAVNFNLGMVQVLITPMVLGFTDSQAMGMILSVGGVGVLVGSGVMLAWGGPRRRVHGVLGFVLLQGLLLFAMAARPSVGFVAVSMFGVLFTLSLVDGCDEPIWQSKVPQDLQGRVFSVRSTVAGASLPLAYVVAGPLCDRVAEPLMAEQGLLASSVGRLLGTGSGRGAALLFLVLGGLTLVSVAVGYLYRPLRRLDDDDRTSAHAIPVPGPRHTIV